MPTFPGRFRSASITALVLACAAEPSLRPAPTSAPRAPLPRAEIQVVRSRASMPFSVVRAKNYRIEFWPYAMEIDPQDGGRILELSCEGESAVVPRTESPEAYGSSFWTSPQSDWQWPPPPELDKKAWRVRIEGETLVLESDTSEKLGLSAEQRLQAMPELGALRIDLVLFNRSHEPRKVAPWQNTRVRPGGLTFYPSDQPSFEPSTLKLVPSQGIVWYQHEPGQVREGTKSFADGSDGWLAQADGRLLFVKVFPDVPRKAQAPGEAEIELYVDGAGRFVEVEQQGPYIELAPGQSSTWTLYWLIRKLPESVTPAAGNTELVRRARALAASVRGAQGKAR